MAPDDSWWDRQLIEGLKEASRLYQMFREALEPNVDDFDKAREIYDQYISAYDLKEISFEEFIDFGDSLRARQAISSLKMDV